jgi:hypothetical protein
LKKIAPYRTVWRMRFERGGGPVRGRLRNEWRAKVTLCSVIHINIVCGQNVELFSGKSDCT